ncbi:hypothetical protein diail_11319 [Diaporthe ilicicola]|nr:hypothetical protein diail_11319 [Diaporthe ilicicola]
METAGFVPEPSAGRGTISIIWGCLTTIIFVVWTALHPDYHPSMPRAMWGVFIFFVPEAMPAGAFGQLIRARKLQRRLRGVPGWESWALKQSFLIVKKGVRDTASGEVLTASGLLELVQQRQQQRRRQRQQKDQQQGQGREEEKHSTGIRMGMLPDGDAIDRRSKKSWFEKIVAGGQALWFCANIVSRLAGGYQITPLEDMTVAYTCCGLIASVAWLRCPQDIEDPFEVDLGGAAAAAASVPDSLSVAGGGGGGGVCVGGGSPDDLSDRFMSGMVCLVLGLFTGIHLAAWRYPFPSAAEAWVWRCCSVATLPLGLLVLSYGDRDIRRSRHWSLAVTVPGYVLVRLALLTVAATAFRRMPLSVFDTPDWSDYWGHVGK